MHSFWDVLQDFYDLTSAYLEKAAVEGVIWAEVMFDPQAHTRRGVTFEAVVKGVSRALSAANDSLGIHGCLIMNFMRDLGFEAAQETLEEVTISILGCEKDVAANFLILADAPDCLDNPDSPMSIQQGDSGRSLSRPLPVLQAAPASLGPYVDPNQICKTMQCSTWVDRQLSSSCQHLIGEQAVEGLIP